MSCVVWLRIAILYLGITAVFNKDKGPTTTKVTTKKKVTTKATTTTTEGTTTEATTTDSTYIDSVVNEDEYTEIKHEYCIDYDDECQQSLVRSQKHNTSHSRRFKEKSKLLTKLAGTVKPIETRNFTASKVEKSKTSV